MLRAITSTTTIRRDYVSWTFTGDGAKRSLATSVAPAAVASSGVIFWLHAIIFIPNARPIRATSRPRRCWCGIFLILADVAAAFFRCDTLNVAPSREGFADRYVKRALLGGGPPRVRCRTTSRSRVPSVLRPSATMTRSMMWRGSAATTAPIDSTSLNVRIMTATEGNTRSSPRDSLRAVKITDSSASRNWRKLRPACWI